MKMKALVIAGFIFFCMTFEAMSLPIGLGAQLNYHAGGVFAPGASLLISLNDKTHAALNWYVDTKSDDEDNIFGISVDRIILSPRLFGTDAVSFNATFGAGGYLNIVFGDDLDFSGGVRVPLGFNLYLGHSVFELFVSVAPSFGVRFLPSLGLSSPFFPVALGGRFWFR